MQPAQPAAEVTVSGGDHFSLHQRLAQGTAGVKCRVVGSLRAGHALANEVHPCAVAVTLPGAHPLAVSPSIGTEESDFFTCCKFSDSFPIF